MIFITWNLLSYFNQKVSYAAGNLAVVIVVFVVAMLKSNLECMSKQTCPLHLLKIYLEVI